MNLNLKKGQTLLNEAVGDPPKRMRSVPALGSRENLNKLATIPDISQRLVQSGILAEWLNTKFGFSSVIVNLNNNIWFYTTADIAVSVEFDHEQFLHLHLSSALFPSDIYLSIVYAMCNRVLRRDLWKNLLECNPQDGCPWIVGGDFNIISDPLDQSSGLVNHSGAILEPMHLLDQEWLNTKFGFSSVIVNLNNNIWFYTTADIAVSVEFDHEQFLHLHLSSALFPKDIYLSIVYAKCNRVLRRDLWKNLLECNPQDGGDFNIIADPLDQSSGLVNHSGAFIPKPVSSFRFQNMWFLHHLSLNWNYPCVEKGLIRLVVKLKRLKYHLKWWNQEVSRNIHDKVRDLDLVAAQAEEIYDSDNSEENRAALSLAQANLSLCLAMEEAFWKQKASAKWMVDGEKNSKLFHNMVNRRRARNTIFRIWDEGVALETPSSIRESGVRFFENLLTGDPAVPSKPSFDRIPVLIDKADNFSMLAPISEKEVFDSVCSLHEDSAAGPDGFSAGFYRKCWDIIKEDLTEAIRDCWARAPLPRSFSATTIILIPKMKLRRDGLNSGRLAYAIRILPKIISPSQSGFVAGRLISDNILLAQEMVNHINYPIRGGNIFMKLDMAKAYDRVLHAFGFSDGVCHQILRCINNIWFSININGTLSGFFPSNRGLRQGDPLSPLLFVIAAEYLSKGLDNLFSRHRSLNYRIGWPFCLSHLAYADDIIIFSNGSIPGIRTLRDFSHHYKHCSGFLLQKYFRTDPLAAVRIMQNISASWRRLMKIRNRAESEIGWRIGDGDISFWFDTWFPDGPLSSLVSIQRHPNRLVSWFMDDRNWNLGRLLLVLPQEVAFRVLEVPIQREAKGNTIWKISINGRFSLKSAWDLVAEDWHKDGHARELIPFLIIWDLEGWALAWIP
ncbi:uncharacterized protein [Henckelia pumila]|uniref:uncharacterized protein n=1 Tax=Henckelia pumila TaxID=405737 RepID=UPI003C6DF17E